MRLESHRTGPSDLIVSRRAERYRALGYGAIAGSAAKSTDSILSPDAVDLDSELAYWRGYYRDLKDRGLRFSDCEPAVKLGLDAYMRGHGRHFAEMEQELQACYRRVRALSRMDWDEARPVVAAAWERLYRKRHAQ